MIFLYRWFICRLRPRCLAFRRHPERTGGGRQDRRLISARCVLAVVLPLSGPGIAAVTIFSFLFSYNEYLVASCSCEARDNDNPGRRPAVHATVQTDWGSLMAAATMAMLPTVVFLLFVQKSMVYGAVAGSVKG